MKLAIFAILMCLGFSFADTQCYQENATSTNDGCGLPTNGAYGWTDIANWNNPTLINDSDYATSGDAVAICPSFRSMLINYTTAAALKPLNWTVKTTVGGTVNITIPLNCTNAFPSVALMNLSQTTSAGCASAAVNLTCWDGTGWTRLYDTALGAGAIFEEGMWMNTTVVGTLPDCNSSDFAITFNQNLSNASTNITATAYYTGAAAYTSYNWSATSWNATLINWNASTSSNFVVNCSAYPNDCRIRVFVNARGINSSCQTPVVTNSTLVYTSTSLSYGTDFIQNQIGTFATQYGGLIFGIVAIALAYAFGGTLSNTALITSILYFVIYFVMGISIFIYGAIALLILGIVMRYAGI